MSEEIPSIFCSKCGKQIKNKQSKYCPSCGHELNIAKETLSKKENTNNKDMSQNIKVVKYEKNPALAAILTFFLFCLGQFYNGQILKGIVFVLLLIILWYINIFLGLLFLIYAAYDAYKNAKYIKENNGNYFYNGAI
ncbi:zinc-ribbon domain-containing protein [Methanobrevibacter sp. TMH8]|uniref:zinc-ribbon domain-containing protein n=1 Tax=Methanobrevibacter sp. TMH8 TaxID=2848611 RepID=UPI001CD00E40|nr:zinc-ribbon domain-containing protein [Methanobrevibacter sp. TMH8]MBZ9570574.1 zinc-ribbon domain-containing protein [Methanobrevibacter sp. TMH8]